MARSDSGRDADARTKAIDFIVNRELATRRSADGALVGIQAILARADEPEVVLDLDLFLDAMVVDPEAHDSAFSSDPAREGWRAIANMASEKLGFPLEPELFSNMLFVAHLGRDPDPRIRELCLNLLSTFRDRHVGGLYHFFASLKFACDVDCTAMAARARLASGDIDPATSMGAKELRTITSAILRSAAVRDVESDANMTHGKSNGALSKNVFKVYLDDHLAQPPGCDRGLKINPVVVSNALGPVLLEIKLGLRRLDEVVDLLEYVEGVAEPRTGRATVLEIVAANIAYANAFLFSGEWRDGCRYYPSPDAFLCSYSENLRDYPELFGAFDAVSALREAIEIRRNDAFVDRATDPSSSLNVALRSIAAANANIDASLELDMLAARQDGSGAWSDIDCLYAFGGNTAIPVHFRSPVLTTAFAIRALSPAPAKAGGSGAFPVGSTAWVGTLVDAVLGPHAAVSSGSLQPVESGPGAGIAKGEHS